MPPDHAFDIDSTVGRYWLVNGSGFELVERGGRSLGVVEDVVLDPSTQRVDTMVVKRHAMIKRARVPPAELTAVVPAAKVFVIASAGRECATAWPSPPRWRSSCRGVASWPRRSACNGRGAGCVRGSRSIAAAADAAAARPDGQGRSVPEVESGVASGDDGVVGGGVGELALPLPMLGRESPLDW